MNLDYIAGLYDHGGIFSIVSQGKYHRSVIALPVPHAITMEVQNEVGGHYSITHPIKEPYYLLQLRPRELVTFNEKIGRRLIVKAPQLAVINELAGMLAPRGKGAKLTNAEFSAREDLRHRIWILNHPNELNGFKRAKWEASV